MSKSRKTIAVTDLVDRANAFLAIGELPERETGQEIVRTDG